jgi:ribosome-binding factor A
MPSERQEKMNELIRKHVATFIEKESTSQSLITVTRVDISPDFKNGTIFFTTLPEREEKTALLFLQRKRSDLRDYLKKHLKTRIIPFVDIVIDEGERNRQKIDALLFQENHSEE